MAVWTDPRFSEPEKRIHEQRVADNYGKSGIAPGVMMALGALFGLVLLGIVIGLGHPETPTTLADRTLDRAAPLQPAYSPPSAPNAQ